MLTLVNFAAGDGCFYVGLGGKSVVPKPASYEPYQCCPTKLGKGTKVAKMTATKLPKPSVKKNEGSSKKSESNTKPFTPARSANKKDKPITAAAKPEKKEKGKKGFFGIGKYIKWW